MLPQLDFRSYFHFLGRNRLYAAINLFGLAVSLTFVILIADYALRQLTRDDRHTKADRIYAIGSEEDASSGYYLQKYLRDRYPEIESTCALGAPDEYDEPTQPVEVGQRKYTATILYADTTFFRIFDFPLLEGDRDEALAARDNVVLSESFARKVFGSFSPLGQTIRFPDDGKSYLVSGVVRDIDRSVIPNMDIIMRPERMCAKNPSNNEHMSNAGSVITFLVVRPGADLEAKIPDMLAFFREIYWIYTWNVYNQVTLTPLRELYFSPLNRYTSLHHGSWSFVVILFAVGAVILLFAVINYVNLTVAQTGFRAKEMAARRLLGASRGGIVLKLILESTLFCLAAFVVAFFLAVAAEPFASRLLEVRIDVRGDLTPAVVACYAAFVAVLGLAAGLAPAMLVSRYKPIDVVRGTFRRHTKQVYGKMLITLQYAVTIILIAASLTIGLQIRRLITAPLGYRTEDILDVPASIFSGGYDQIRRFRDELRQLPCVEVVALGCGTPFDRGNNNSMQIGPDRRVSFQTFIGDSAYHRLFGFDVLRDNHTSNMDWWLNQHALRELGIEEDTPSFKAQADYSQKWDIGGIYRDFQVGSALDPPTSVLILNVGDYDRYQKAANFWGSQPSSVLVKTRGDKSAAYAAVGAVFERISDGGMFTGAKYLEQQIEESYADMRRILHIVSLFTFVAALISALGLLAMSTYYIQQKHQEIAVRKVFGSTRGELLGRLVGSFMRLVGAAFVAAVPAAWYLLSRWLEDYSVRIALSPLIFLAAGLFSAVIAFLTVSWQSGRAADADPIDAIKN